MPQALQITSTGVGQFEMGKTLPDVEMESGYFASTSLFQQPLMAEELVALLSPKNRLYHLLVGPKYTTDRGARIGTSFEELQVLYPDISAGTTKMGQDFVYRPDHIILDDSFLDFRGASSQRDRRDLKCSLSSEALPNVSFFFEVCPEQGMPRSKAVVAAIMITHPDEAEIAFVDPILDLDRILPCPEARTDDPKGMAKRGDVLLHKDMMGEYFSINSVEAGLPMLRDAAISGSVEAAFSYVGMIDLFVHQEYIGDPLSRPMDQGSQEALLFTLLSYMRTQPQPHSCEELLLNLDMGLSESIFHSTEEEDEHGDYGPCQDDYRFILLSLSDIEAIRQQANAWKGCWDEGE